MQVGKLTTEDIRLFLSLLPLFEKERAEAMAVVKEKRSKIFRGDHVKVTWCNFYEMPFLEHLGRFVAVFGIGDVVKTINEATNPMQALVSSIDAFDKELEAEGEVTAEEIEQARQVMPIILALNTSLYNSFRCLLAFGCYLNDLIVQVRGGDDGALFNAVRIDPTTMGCPTILTRISQAVLEEDRRFFAKLKAAMAGNLKKREQANFQKMRLVFQVLHETNAGHLSDDQLHELFVKELRLYSSDLNTKRGDARKNLRKFANQYMANATT